eukprot:CAMPEP_0196576734 /NCGR_PEP_ID=MMETSP1081-20130531/5918_1 /TAXON_ID=36882 /ORGANISM="Pyramimonas amylifera, Strain CCMP720" /LENGTH=112 /DNA_ID=CAMNT_0041895421 /DNA_START=155 /DNA_END=493 /DNA_ORIENTATION=+
MAAITCSIVAPVAVAPATRLASRKTFAGAKVAQKKVTATASINTVCKAEKKESLATAVVAATVAIAATPEFAHAAPTASLNNMVASFLAGGLVLAVLATAVVGVATFDKVRR